MRVNFLTLTKIKNTFSNFVVVLKSSKTVIWLYILNIAIATPIVIHIRNYQSNLPSEIPFYYTQHWGINQLAPSSHINLLIIAVILIFIINLTMTIVEIYKGNLNLGKVYPIISIVTTSLLLYYSVRILELVVFEPITIPVWITLIILPLILALFVTILITPLVIKFAKKYGFMDDPLTHKHPGMLIKRPTPRAGGLAFFMGVLIPSIILLPILSSQKLIGILLAAAICVLIGLKDDKKDVSPYIRLIGQAIIILLVVLSGIILIYIPNPFGESINLDNYRWTIDFLGKIRNIHYFAVIAAGLWIGLTMNFMSFANGTDGVYAGLVTIASLVIAILMMQSLPEDSSIAIFIQLAAITAGAGLGMAVFTWPPQKILWGFGATSAGLIIAALSILGSTKVATMLIVLIIPFLDGVFAIVRRLRRGQMPFWGDREHLHHKLLEGLGWSKQKVAIFYWTTTLTFGIIGILTSGETRALSLLTMLILGIFAISSLNFIKNPKSTNN